VFAVRVTRGGVLVGDHPFTLRTNYVDGSGGHDHTNRRTDNNENYGYFISQQGSRQQGRPLSENTLTNVMNAFEYVASIWGDTMKIIATSGRHPKFLTDTMKIVERIAGLELLPEGTNYVKVGGTTEHHGPPASATDHNHYGTGRLTTQVQTIADSFTVAFERYRLRINDMSLPLGGAFDIFASWDQDVIEPNCRQQGHGHCGHRRGTNADISFQVINPQGQQVLTTSRQRRRLLEIIRNIAGFPVTHRDHYHIQ
jgi:hypothetical protein